VAADPVTEMAAAAGISTDVVTKDGAVPVTAMLAAAGVRFIVVISDGAAPVTATLPPLGVTTEVVTSDGAVPVTATLAAEGLNVVVVAVDAKTSTVAPDENTVPEKVWAIAPSDVVEFFVLRTTASFVVRAVPICCV
jgi:hypothetical protein